METHKHVSRFKNEHTLCLGISSRRNDDGNSVGSFGLRSIFKVKALSSVDGVLRYSMENIVSKISVGTSKCDDVRRVCLRLLASGLDLLKQTVVYMYLDVIFIQPLIKNRMHSSTLHVCST